MRSTVSSDVHWILKLEYYRVEWSGAFPFIDLLLFICIGLKNSKKKLLMSRKRTTSEGLCLHILWAMTVLIQRWN